MSKQKDGPDEDAFSPRDWSFPSEHESSGTQDTSSSDEKDIKESLQVLLTTQRGERIAHPEYGCGFQKISFEQMDVAALSSIREQIENAVLFFEPRINLTSVELDASAWKDSLLEVTLTYTVVATKAQSLFVHPIYLTKGSRR